MLNARCLGRCGIIAILSLAASAVGAEDLLVLQQLQRETSDQAQIASAELMVLRQRVTAGAQREVSRDDLEQLALEREAVLSQRQAVQARLDNRRRQLKQPALSGAEVAATQALVTALEVRLGQLDERLLLLAQLQQAYAERYQLATSPESAEVNSERIEIDRQIQQEIRRAQDLRAAAAALRGTDAASVAKRRLLEVRAFISEAELDRLELSRELVPWRAQLDTLDELSLTSGLPGRALAQARTALRDLQRQLGEAMQRQQGLQQSLSRMQEVVERRGRVLSGSGSTQQTQLDELQAFAERLTEQGHTLSQLQARATATATAVDAALTTVLAREFTTRKSLPANATEWASVSLALWQLPQRLAQSYIRAGRNFLEHLQQQGAGFALISAWLVALLAWLARGWLRRRATSTRLGATLQSCLQLVASSMLGLTLPAWVGLLGWRYGFSATDWILWLTPCLVWPLVRMGLNLSNLLLFRKPEHRGERARLRLQRQLRWILLLLPVPAAVFVILQALQVDPALADLLDRTAMLALLLIALPLVYLREVMLRSLAARFGNAAWIGLMGAVATVVPVSLLISALAGIAGYTQLAYEVGQFLGQAGLVLLAALLSQHMLRDGHERLGMRLRARPGGAFNARYLLLPIYQLTSLLIFVLAIWLLLQWYGWNAESPGVRQALAIWHAELLTVADSPIHLSNLVGTAVFVFLVFWFGRWTREVLLRSLASRLPDLGVRHSLSTFTQYFIVVIGLLIAVHGLGLKLTSLAIFAGALGVGLGFGLQNIANNFVSGILLLAERPLRNRDLVRIDTFEGEVTQIGIRSLTVRTWDNEEVVIPNSEVISKPFTNWTRGDDVLRVTLYFGVSYKADPHAVRAGIEAVLAANAEVLDTPVPAVMLWEFADSAVVFRIQYFIHVFGKVHRNMVRSQVLFGIWDMCKAEGFEIPFPQRDVHLYTHGESGPNSLPDQAAGSP